MSVDRLLGLAGWLDRVDLAGLAPLDRGRCLQALAHRVRHALAVVAAAE